MTHFIAECLKTVNKELCVCYDKPGKIKLLELTKFNMCTNTILELPLSDVF